MVINEDLREAMKNNPGLHEAIRSTLIALKLKEYCKEKQDEFWHKDLCDLNPHLLIEHVIKEVVERVKVEGLECTRDEVMLTWLTFLHDPKEFRY